MQTEPDGWDDDELTEEEVREKQAAYDDSCDRAYEQTIDDLMEE